MTSLEHPHSAPPATGVVDLGAIARNIGRVRDITATPILTGPGGRMAGRNANQTRGTLP
jgi:hypothetical protein